MTNEDYETIKQGMHEIIQTIGPLLVHVRDDSELNKVVMQTLYRANEAIGICENRNKLFTVKEIG